MPINTTALLRQLGLLFVLVCRSKAQTLKTINDAAAENPTEAASNPFLEPTRRSQSYRLELNERRRRLADLGNEGGNEESSSEKKNLRLTENTKDQGEEDSDDEDEEEEEEESGSSSSSSEEEEDFLYESGGRPVIDYHAAPNASDPLHPDFLYSPNNGHRMVEFYAVWCPHCRHFRGHYIQTARQVKAIIKDNDLEDVAVYAVACNMYKPICRDYNISGYPQIRLFKANSTKIVAQVNYWEIHAFDVLSLLGIQPAQDFGGDPVVPIEEGNASEGADNKKRVQKALAPKPHHRSKQDMFNDAYLSFDFSLRNGIFMQRGPLPEKTANALHEWLELLKRSTPVAWQVIPVVNELLKQFDKIKQSENDLMEVLNKFPPPRRKKWSQSCTHGEVGAGYTCGLWQLFHIVTVGVVEWNLMIYEGEHLILSTEESSRRLRNFIEHFFACNECRMNFISAYDQCMFDRCHRLREPGDPNAENSLKEWMELPLWLFETHNAVNLRLMKERARREQRSWTHQDEIASQWPSRSDCPRCWREDGAWDDLMVYKYIRSEYWPDDGITTLYRDALSEPLPVFDDDAVSSSSKMAMPPFFLQILPVLVVSGLGLSWYMKMQERRRSGWHKRIE